MAEYINNTEYIDRKELVNNINRLVKLTNKDEQEWVKDECIRQAYCIEKADVVPRYEVERLQGELILAKALAKVRLDAKEAILCKEGQEFVAKAKQEVAREIFEELKEDLNNLINYYEEKRKYVTEIDYNELEQLYCDMKIKTFEERLLKIAELKKKYIGDKGE